MKTYIVGPAFTTQGGISSVLRLYKESFGDTLDLRFIASYSGFGRIKDLAYFSACILRVLLLCIFSKDALFHIHMASKGSYLRKSIIAGISGMFGKKHIIHIHGAMFDTFIEGSSVKRKQRIVRTLMTAQKVIVLSQSWKSYFMKYLPEEKLAVIYNPAPFIADAYAARGNRTPKALFMGRLGDRKGIYDLLEAVKKIDVRRFELDIYGDGEVEKVRTIVEQAGLSDIVRLCGWVGHSKVSDIYDNADFLVLPSYAEGLPMSVLEAIGRGLPVISTDVGGIAEAVVDGENGFLIQPGDVDALAQRIRSLAEDKCLREKMGRAGLCIAGKKFSVQSIGRQLEEIYESLGGGGPDAAA